MSFSLSGSTITQTGTDASLSGLSSVPGVTTISNGTNTVYNLGNRNLIVNGTLTIDPEVEELSFGTSAPYPMVGVAGTLNIGFQLDAGGTAFRYSAGTWARFARQSASTSADTQSALRIETSGTLHWYGGAMFCKAQVAFMSGSNVTIYSQQAQIIWQVSGNIRQLRMLSALADIRGLVTKGGFVTFIANPAAWAGWAPFDASGQQALSFSSTSPDNVFYNLRNFDPSGLNPVQHVAVWSNSWGRLINGALGSAVVVGGNSNDNSNNTGLYEIRQELTVNVSSFSAGSVAGVKLYMVDTNNGGRLAANQIESNPDYVANRTYTHTFDGTGTHTFDSDGGILTAVIHRQVGGLRLSGFTSDRRSRLNDITDTFRQIFGSYLYNIGVFDISLVGIGGTTLDATLFDDTSITEPDYATALAYTTTSNNAEAYDHLKAILVRDFAGEDEVTATGAGNFGARNVVLTASTGEASVAPTSVTLNTGGSFTGSLTTTGDIVCNAAMTLGGGTYSKVVLPVGFSGTLTLDGATVTEIENTSGSAVTVSLLNSATASTLTETSGTLTAVENVTVAASNIADGSRVQLWNVTKAAELDNSTVSGGGGYSYTVNLQAASVEAGDTLRLRATQIDGVTGLAEFEQASVVTTSGLSFIGSQSPNEVYNTLAIDGSTVTKFSPDYAGNEVDIAVASNFTAAEFYAWWVANLTTADGIRNFFGGVTAIDTANFRINNSVVAILFDNTTTSNLHQTDNRRIFRSDLARPVKEPTTGGGGIDVEWRSPVSLANTDAITASLDAILEDTGTTLPAQISGISSGSAPSEAEIYTYFTSSSREDAFKADVSALATQAGVDALPTLAEMEASGPLTAVADVSGVLAAIAGLNDFNPAADTVARVTLVDTTTTNTDMRGTDAALLASAYTAAPSAATVASQVRTELTTELDRIDVAVSTRSSHATPDLSGLSTHSAADVWTVSSRTITGGQVDTMAGTIQTLDALDTAQDAQHSQTQADVAAVGTPTLDPVQIRNAVGLASANLDTQLGAIDSNVSAVLVDTGSTIPASIAGLNNVSSADIQAAAEAAIAASEPLASNVTQVAGSAVTGVADFRANVSDLSTHSAADVWTVSSRTITGGQVDTMAGTIQTLDALDTAQDAQHSTTQAAVSVLNDPSAATIATAVRAELSTELGRIDTEVSSRLASGAYTAPLDAGQTGAAVWGAARSAHTTAGTFGSVVEWSGVPHTPATIADSVWDEALGDHTSAGSVGAALVTINGGVQSASLLVPHGVALP